MADAFFNRTNSVMTFRLLAIGDYFTEPAEWTIYQKINTKQAIGLQGEEKGKIREFEGYCYVIRKGGLID